MSERVFRDIGELAGLRDRIADLEAAHAEAERLKTLYLSDAGAALRRTSEVVEAVRRYAAGEISGSKLAEVCGLPTAETARGLNERVAWGALIAERDEWKRKAEGLLFALELMGAKR